MSDADKQPELKAPTEPNLEKESISETDIESKDVTDTESKDDEKIASCIDNNEIKVDADMKVEPVCPEKNEEEHELDFEDEPAVVNGKSKESIEVKEEVEGADVTHTEEGACTPEKQKTEETKDDGECSDGGDEDLEEGELNEKDDVGGGTTNSKPTSATKSLCRFYSRGLCFFGANCRFSHINATAGNNYYSMFSTTPTPSARPAYDTSTYYDSSAMMGHTHRSGPLPSRSGSDFVPPPLACSEPVPDECAWVRGLETAKELVKRAHKRKIEDKNFSEKSLNLSLEKNEKNEERVFIERDTRDSYKRKRRDMVEFPKYDEPLEAAYDYREPYRDVGFDHFDVRYHREERKGGDRRMDREPRDKGRDFRPKSPRSKERYRDDRIDRLEEVEPPLRPSHYSSRGNVNNVNSFFDPWRRSKSPKGTARRSRSRSGSYSSVSSYSWSDRSFSSNSYSRSSRSSSRSPPHQKRKLSPTITNPPFASERPGPVLTNTFTTMREKKPQHTGLPSRSRTPSISRSRSFSRSISMSSVSSASSARGSSRDRDSLSNSSGSRSGRQNSASILRKQDENAALPVGKTVDPLKVSGPSPAAVPLPSMYLNYPLRENTIHDTIESPVIEESEPDPLEEQFLHPKKPEVEKPFPSLQHLLPSNDKVKETLKVASHKPQIKLTLLPKKELDRKSMGDDPSKSAGFYFGVKGPLSPPTPPVIAKPTPVLVPKKSASSRRDELLKQLKAVEDAIARKRAKFG